MPIRYFDRGGREMTAAEWRRCFRTPKYYLLRCTKRPDGLYVKVTWVGVQHDGEDERRLFYVEQYRKVRAGNSKEEKTQLVQEEWCSSEPKAIATAKRWENA